MTIEQIVSKIPDYARDLRINLPNVLNQAELSEQQGWGTAVACAIASRNPELVRAVLGEAAAHLSREALQGAKAAAAIMGMNNSYYRYQHLVGNDAYRTIPARLRMQMIRMHGADPVDFELWCAAVSAINGCGACLASHEATVRAKGITEDKVAAAIRIASVVHAVAAVLDAEAATGAAASA
jgi:alkyl hydroperoxide reductase subunit D